MLKICLSVWYSSTCVSICSPTSILYGRHVALCFSVIGESWEVMGKVTVLSVPVCKFKYVKLHLLFTNIVCNYTGKCLQIQRGRVWWWWVLVFFLMQVCEAICHAATIVFWVSEVLLILTTVQDTLEYLIPSVQRPLCIVEFNFSVLYVHSWIRYWIFIYANFK